MKMLMLIDTTHGGIFFSLTYLAAILVTAGMTIFYGFRKGYPKTTWLLILVSGLLFFIIGEKVASYSSGEWMQVFTGFQLPQTHKKTILGGILGLFAGLTLAKHTLRFNRPVLDSFAIALPVGMAISRIGCLMAGCCFGTPTNLPWGIHYDASSWAYKVHLEQRLIHFHDKTSLAVHPVQLYQVLGCLTIALIVWRTRKQWKAGGSLFLFSVLCYALLRFLIEFVRDPESSFIMTEVLFGLKVIQWVIIAATLFGILILIFRESKRFEALSDSKNHRNGLLLIIISMIVFSGRKWFDPLELSAIIVFLVPVFIAMAVKFYQKFSVAGFRWVVPVMLVFSFSFMAQKSIPDKKKDDKMIFTEVGFAGQIGKYYEELQRVSMSCGEPSYVTLHQQSTTFYQTGMDVSYNIWKGRYTKYRIGGRLFIGNEVQEQTTISSGNGPVYGITPYVSLNGQWIGFGTGLSVGHMNIPVGRPKSSLHDGDIVTKGHSWTTLSPTCYLRVGPTDILYAEASFPGVFPYMTPYPSFLAGFGTGLGRTNGTKAAFGYCNNAFYLSMVYPIKDKFVVEAFYADNLQSGVQSSRIFSFGFNYRIFDESNYKDKMKICTTLNSELVKSSPQVKKPSSKIEDSDGNKYSTITAGGQVWMDEDLKTTRYRNGSEISGITDNVTGSGKRYTWYAVTNSNNLCPAGWHIPSINEWRMLIKSLGSSDVAARKLENFFNTGGKPSQWWSSTEQDTLQAQSIYLNNENIGIMFANQAKKSGLSVRCLRDH